MDELNRFQKSIKSGLGRNPKYKPYKHLKWTKSDINRITKDINGISNKKDAWHSDIKDIVSKYLKTRADHGIPVGDIDPDIKNKIAATYLKFKGVDPVGVKPPANLQQFVQKLAVPQELVEAEAKRAKEELTLSDVRDLSLLKLADSTKARLKGDKVGKALLDKTLQELATVPRADRASLVPKGEIQIQNLIEDLNNTLEKIREYRAGTFVEDVGDVGPGGGIGVPVPPVLPVLSPDPTEEKGPDAPVPTALARLADGLGLPKLTNWLSGHKKSELDNPITELKSGEVKDIAKDIRENPSGFEFHLPKHNYAGPGTNFHDKLVGPLTPQNVPVNEVDRISFEHDFYYTESKDPLVIQAADNRMLKQLEPLLALNDAGAAAAYAAIKLKTVIEQTYGQSLGADLSGVANQKGLDTDTSRIANAVSAFKNLLTESGFVYVKNEPVIKDRGAAGSQEARANAESKWLNAYQPFVLGSVLFSPPDFQKNPDPNIMENLKQKLQELNRHVKAGEWQQANGVSDDIVALVDDEKADQQYDPTAATTRKVQYITDQLIPRVTKGGSTNPLKQMGGIHRINAQIRAANALAGARPAPTGSPAQPGAPLEVKDPGVRTGGPGVINPLFKSKPAVIPSAASGTQSETPEVRLQDTISDANEWHKLRPDFKTIQMPVVEQELAPLEDKEIKMETIDFNYTPVRGWRTEGNSIYEMSVVGTAIMNSGPYSNVTGVGEIVRNGYDDPLQVPWPTPRVQDSKDPGIEKMQVPFFNPDSLQRSIPFKKTEFQLNYDTVPDQNADKYLIAKNWQDSMYVEPESGSMFWANPKPAKKSTGETVTEPPPNKMLASSVGLGLMVFDQ